MTVTAGIQIHFGPRISLAGRRFRYTRAAAFRMVSATAPAMSSCRVRGLRSAHFFLSPTTSSVPGGPPPPELYLRCAPAVRPASGPAAQADDHIVRGGRDRPRAGSHQHRGGCGAGAPITDLAHVTDAPGVDVPCRGYGVRRGRPTGQLLAGRAGPR